MQIPPEAIFQALEAIDAIAGIAEKIAAALKGRRDAQLEDAVDTLRLIYFPPDGILHLLKAIESGAEPSKDQVRDALINFNDREPQVARALERLDQKQLLKKWGIPIKYARTLDLVRMGKISLRASIQGEINRYGQPRQRPDRAVIRKLVARIERLNAEIENAELALLETRRRG